MNTFLPIVLSQAMVYFLVLSTLLIALVTATNIRSICASLPASCYVETSEYSQLVGGATFQGTASYSDELHTNVGSCGYPPSSLPAHLVGLPLPFMFMSDAPTVCNPNCNLLCGRCVQITNLGNGLSIIAQVIDTSNTRSAAIVLSRSAFTALGTDPLVGRMNVAFKIASCQ